MNNLLNTSLLKKMHQQSCTDTRYSTQTDVCVLYRVYYTPSDRICHIMAFNTASKSSSVTLVSVRNEAHLRTHVKIRKPEQEVRVSFEFSAYAVQPH